MARGQSKRRIPKIDHTEVALDYSDDEVANEEEQTWPPLDPAHTHLRELCRLGDPEKLRQFLTETPGLDIDVMCPDGSTLLNEAVTKTAQFSQIVEVLLNFGARLDVCDSLGNSPLHNAALYHPSTQETVDLLLLKGADPGARNFQYQTPVTMTDDKDLKDVLKEMKIVGKKKGKSRENIYSPDLRRKVTIAETLSKQATEKLKIRFDQKSTPCSRGLLKRKLDSEWENETRKRNGSGGGSDEENSPGDMNRRSSNGECHWKIKKKIRWCEEYNTGGENEEKT